MLEISSKSGKTQSKLVYDIVAVSPINTATENHLQPLPWSLMGMTTALVSREYRILGKYCDIVPIITSEQVFSYTAAEKLLKKFLSYFPAVLRRLAKSDERDRKNVM